MGQMWPMDLPPPPQPGSVCSTGLGPAGAGTTCGIVPDWAEQVLDLAYGGRPTDTFPCMQHPEPAVASPGTGAVCSTCPRLARVDLASQTS